MVQCMHGKIDMESVCKLTLLIVVIELGKVEAARNRKAKRLWTHRGNHWNITTDRITVRHTAENIIFPREPTWEFWRAKGNRHVLPRALRVPDASGPFPRDSVIG